ncbi:hypothetical protein CANCADRAFT_106311 [Tortispora caseinolytica NRRL Y-17796]|uniref:DNA/RNA-binding protein Kin17 WH-like domain-containing protein n=1 Tax=Tortispora caseinolytica NRRL Y-17796 TaxID=767744 RepID=A0A1E4TF61_9ASCO|nr:hypothetical protein CANCADRAFT_106311 [Tortispora caseinolytica NRRL Y-17796]
MARAEFGTPKYVANKMKAKGLQRLRWYCQACEKQCRDENGFKCHVASESHVKKMLAIAERPNEKINEYSNMFKSDFVTLLRTTHGEKPIKANQFYQEYIRNKSHIHMNATRWNSLTEFIKYLGREGICRVETSNDSGQTNATAADGFTIAWIDTSQGAQERKKILAKDSSKADEERSQREVERQIDLMMQSNDGLNEESVDHSIKSKSAPLTIPLPLLKKKAVMKSKTGTNVFKARKN